MVCAVFLCLLWNMASFSVMEDEDFDGMFLTQRSSADNVVSLEENVDLEVLKDPQYSDISDDEQDSIEERMR